MKTQTNWQNLRKSGVAMTPQNYHVVPDHIPIWRRFLKRQLLQERGRVCEECGKENPDAIHLHEGIVKRNEVPRNAPLGWQIYSEINSFLLCGNCHLNKPLTRGRYYWKACQRYSKAEVDEWLASLPFRSPALLGRTG